ncbi:acyl-CoA/acyl-ACP dehydrogenase [Pusillimonas sp. CC-YST705]|uniref:Acyl-CoA/acyl-ACP dehydrogenase n=1 Tax=Mesopusillimonas faecipullorum TaxID=2755040 RepID=A0ABS8CDK5_9BURK|nr:acyl-CoA/acyl-ACP dehydrogenase [Mesopusillimonas faecipullorum]
MSQAQAHPLAQPLPLPESLASWLTDSALALDAGDAVVAEELMPRMGQAGIYRHGVDAGIGGHEGTDIADAIAAVAGVARYSMAAAFVVWSQRTFIEYLIQSPNQGLAQRLLPGLLEGQFAGASGLSNAMKFLGGIEALQVQASPAPQGWSVSGILPWVTNLRAPEYYVASAVQMPDGGAAVMALPSQVQGLTRTEDLSLVGMQGTQTAALRLENCAIGEEWLIHKQANVFLPALRPAFLGIQCGMALGLAARAIEETLACRGAARAILEEEALALRDELSQRWLALINGIRDGEFLQSPAAMFETRIALSDIALQAVALEVQAKGGAGYLRNMQPDVARRWGEAAFIPVVTPSLVQLKTELSKRASRTPAA